MKTKAAVVLLLLLALLLPAFGHDLFLKLDNYFIKAGDKISIKILNGSFQESEGALRFERLQDASIIEPTGTRIKAKVTDFTQDAKTSYLNLQPSEEGTYVVGLSTMTREIDLKAKDFNEYLSHDGIPDTLAERKRTKTLNKDVRERYSKHVKTIFQVGDRRTESYKTSLVYPVEIIPQTNPYALKAGGTFEFLCLKDGKPLVNQFVMSGHENSGGKVVTGATARTNKNGIARVRLTGAGKWYVRFIEMVPMKDPNLNYESKWATLTFAVK